MRGKHMAVTSKRVVAVKSSLSSGWHWVKAKAVILRKYVAPHQKKIIRLLIIASVIAIPIGRMLYLRSQGILWADWTGFGPYTGTLPEENRGKTLWEWMQVLIIPIVLAVGAFLFNASQKRTELKIAQDRLHEEALQSYLDKIGHLLLKEDLLATKDDPEAKVRKIAQVQTVTTLRKLDTTRQNIVIQFIRDAGLADFLLSGASMVNINLHDTNLSEVKLSGADLRKVDLSGTDLSMAFLSEADLYRANLRRAFLFNAYMIGTDLSEVDLSEAFLIGADLSRAELSKANLFGATVIDKQLLKAESLKGAIMPDGTVHE
jgi:uncharacterized protein YjbI with pentapeptide repeats